MGVFGAFFLKKNYLRESKSVPHPQVLIYVTFLCSDLTRIHSFFSSYSQARIHSNSPGSLIRSQSCCVDINILVRCEAEEVHATWKQPWGVKVKHFQLNSSGGNSLKDPKALAVSWIDFNESQTEIATGSRGQPKPVGSLWEIKALTELASRSGVSLFYAPSTVLSMGVFLLIFTNWWLTTDRTEKDTYFLLISEKAFLEQSRRHAHREEQESSSQHTGDMRDFFKTALSRQFPLNFFSRRYANSMLKGLQCLEKIKGMVVICLPLLLLMTPMEGRLSY